MKLRDAKSGARGRTTPYSLSNAKRRLGLLPLFAAMLSACADAGTGTEPPADRIYFPTGLVTSPGGHTLYALNSDFDLGFSGGTLQAFDLDALRYDALLNLASPGADGIPFVHPESAAIAKAHCPGGDPTATGQGFGETCAPPVKPSAYLKSSVVVGAFGTDLQLSNASYTVSGTATRRMFAPARGDASINWFEVADDSVAGVPDARISCGQGSGTRCGSAYRTGTEASENSRGLVLPAQPFGIAQTEAGDALVVTHQNNTQASLLTTGLGAPTPVPPSLEFVVDKVPTGGVSVAVVPVDKDAFNAGEVPAPTFYTTSRFGGNLSRLRYVADTGSSTIRPYLTLDAQVPVVGNAGGGDTRGIVFDPSPRLQCKAAVPAGAPDRAEQLRACARRPARAFVVSRSPASLLYGTVGDTVGTSGGYDAANLTLKGSIPLSAGPSRVYLAPIVDRDGAYELRLFVVCYDAGMLYVIRPDTLVVENVIRTSPGPFAISFDPFDLNEAATNGTVPSSSVSRGGASLSVHKYRFAYVASFLRSQVQMVDLDATGTTGSFESVVFSLGEPVAPKGS